MRITLRGIRWLFEVLLMDMSTYNIYLESYPHISSPNHVKFLEIHTYYSKHSNGSLSPTQKKMIPAISVMLLLELFL